MSDLLETPASSPDLLRNERFHLNPLDRLKVVGMASATVGAGSGFYEGIKGSSLRYLTENAHRLPKTVGGWYFYHKKKNYVMIISGCREALKQGTKYSLGVTSYFALEAGIDYARDTTDFLSSTVAATFVAFAYGGSKHMSRVQKMNYVKKGAFLGLGLGLVQDAMMWSRGGSLWYLSGMEKGSSEIAPQKLTP